MTYFNSEECTKTIQHFLLERGIINSKDDLVYIQYLYFKDRKPALIGCSVISPLALGFNRPIYLYMDGSIVTTLPISCAFIKDWGKTALTIKPSPEKENPASDRTVYIAGPMAGMENYNYDAFYGAEKDLLEQKYKVLNPARLGVIDGLNDWQDYWVINEAMLRGADTVYMLKGWERSPGAVNEHRWAVENGRDIIYQ